jgi:hypothetical protein
MLLILTDMILIAIGAIEVVGGPVKIYLVIILTKHAASQAPATNRGNNADGNLTGYYFSSVCYTLPLIHLSSRPVRIPIEPRVESRDQYLQ